MLGAIAEEACGFAEPQQYINPPKKVNKTPFLLCIREAKSGVKRLVASVCHTRMNSTRLLLKKFIFSATVNLIDTKFSKEVRLLL